MVGGDNCDWLGGAMMALFTDDLSKKSTAIVVALGSLPVTTFLFVITNCFRFTKDNYAAPFDGAQERIKK